ncbi:MAG: hypothetical protein AB2556_25020 [Candidatus Thiodiazotropha sp.]
MRAQAGAHPGAVWDQALAGAPTPLPFKLARLVQITNFDAGGEFCLLQTHQATGDYQ